MTRTRPRLSLLSLEDRAVPAVVLSDNLSNTTGGTTAATATSWLASSFKTDATARNLTEVALSLSGTGAAALDVYTDATNQPTTKVATLTSPTSLSATTLATATFTGSVALTASTTYWVVLRATTGSVNWSFTNDNSGTGTGFLHTFGQTDDSGATWFTGDIFPYQMRVTADGSSSTSGPGTVAFSASTYSVAATAGSAALTVSRTGGSTGAVTVPVTVTGGTAASGSYTVSPSTLSFADGATSATVTVGITAASAFTTAQTVILALGTPTGGATLGGISSATLSISPGSGTTTVTPLVAVGQGSGGSVVRVYTKDGVVQSELRPFPGFTGGARTATADVTGDGTDDVIVGAGPGGSPTVVVYNGATGAEIARFAAFEATFGGGVFVTAGDVDGDDKAEVVVTPDQGGGPVVALYSGAALAAGTATSLNRFLGIDDANFRGGARAALGDVSNNGSADLVVAAGFGGGPRVAVFSNSTLTATSPTRLVNDFFAFESTLRNGTYVAADNGRLTVAGGPGGGPRVRVIDFAKLLTAGSFNTLDQVSSVAQVSDFFAGDSTLRGGVRVAYGDLTGDGTIDLLAGSGAGEASAVRVYSNAAVLAASSTPTKTIDPFSLTLTDGVYVG